MQTNLTIGQQHTVDLTDSQTPAVHMELHQHTPSKPSAKQPSAKHQPYCSPDPNQLLTGTQSALPGIPAPYLLVDEDMVMI